MGGAIGRRLLRGFGMQGACLATQIVLQLVVVKVCLSAWGASVYGDWLVLSALAGFVGFADLGVQGYLANGLRLAWARGETVAGHRMLAIGIALYLALMTVAAGLLGVLLWGFDLPARSGVAALADATPILAWLALTNLLLLPREFVAAVYSARGQFDRQVGLFLMLALAQNGALILGATAGWLLPQTAMAYCGASLLVGWGVPLADLRRRHPDVRLGPRWPTREERRALARVAPFYGLLQGGGVVLIQMPVVLLGAWSTPQAVVVFTTMRTFTGLLRQGVNQIATVVGLELARLYAVADTAAAAILYRRAAVLTGAVVGLGVGVTLLVGPAFFAYWTHGAVRFDPTLAALFLAATLLATPGYLAFGLLRLIDRPQTVALALLVQTLATLALGALLIPVGQASGAAAAVGIGEALAFSPILLGAAGRVLACPVLAMAARSYGAAAAGLGLSIAVGAAVGLKF